MKIAKEIDMSSTLTNRYKAKKDIIKEMMQIDDNSMNRITTNKSLIRRNLIVNDENSINDY